EVSSQSVCWLDIGWWLSHRDSRRTSESFYTFTARIWRFFAISSRFLLHAPFHDTSKTSSFGDTKWSLTISNPYRIVSPARKNPSKLFGNTRAFGIKNFPSSTNPKSTKRSCRTVIDIGVCSDGGHDMTNG